MIGSAKATTIGQYDGDGMWMCGSALASCSASSSSAVATLLEVVMLARSPRSSYLRWKNSSSGARSGSASKLCSFGGLVVIHSRLRASHGSSGAVGVPLRCDTTR